MEGQARALVVAQVDTAQAQASLFPQEQLTQLLLVAVVAVGVTPEEHRVTILFFLLLLLLVVAVELMALIQRD